jgi:hypothetical protein
MPHSVFAQYAGITTSILFFERVACLPADRQATIETWFYRLDMPDEWKSAPRKRSPTLKI